MKVNGIYLLEFLLELKNDLARTKIIQKLKLRMNPAQHFHSVRR